MHANMRVCTHTPSMAAGTHTHPALGPANSSYPWESPDLLPSPCLAAWSLWTASPIPGHATNPPPNPDTHTTAGAHPEPSRAVVFVMAKAVGGLNALNGPDTWIGLTPLPPPPPPAVLVQQPEAPYDEMPQGRGCPRCPRWDSARDTCRCQLTERWAGDRRNRAHLLYTIVSFTEAELETFWVPPGHSG